MADIKISELGAAQLITDNDVFPMTANGVTMKAPAEVLKEYVIGDEDISDIGDGSVTGAIVANNTLATEKKDLWFSSQSISSTSGSSGTLATITNSDITADYVITKLVAANASVIAPDVSCTTSTGQAILTGVSTAATTAEILLTKKAN